ncbi:MAG: hypothetical protein ACTHOU_08820 [Aureliella sp.]
MFAGCAHWSREQLEQEPLGDAPVRQVLNPPKLAPDTVVVDAVLIRFPEEQAAALADVWRVVDESVIDLSTRRMLLANGIQCGVLVGEMPQVIRSRLKELVADDPGNSLERLGLAAEVTSDTQRLHCHAGRRKDLALRPGLSESLTILHTRDGGLHGNTYLHPRVLMDLRATPLGDGRARVKLVPEIEHGETQEVILSSPNQVAQRTEVRRQQQRWDYLAMETTLAQGQFFFCTLTDPPRGLGQALFSTRTSERTTERVLLVLRVMSSQLDDLFAPEQVEAARLAAQH